MPLSGMTGFGRAEGSAGDWSWAVEARSVNGRNLDVRFRGPPGFDGLDRIAREGAQSRFARGQLNIGVQAKRSDSSADVRINEEVLARYLALGAPLVAAGRAGPPSLDGLLALRGVIEAADADDDPQAQATLEAAVALSIGAALEALAESRREEGLALTAVLIALVDKIERLVGEAQGLADGQPVVIKERFARRMAELAGEAVNEDKIVSEAASTCARSHVAADGPQGRRLDFLTQEFMREANTLCSKSALGALTTVGLELKATIEQFREQVQNVE